MPWQRDAVDVALEVDPSTGLYWYSIVIVTVQRQCGKTKLEGDVADHRALTLPDGRIWYTAQTGKDASSWMRDEHFPSLERADIFGRPGTPSARYTRSKRAGQEGVNWNHGSTFRVFPPLRDALHGRQSDLVFVDEAWSLSPDQGADVRQAIRPTMATRRGAQLWIVSTMGDDGSAWFDEYVELGRESLADPNSRVCFIDYGLADDDDPEDLDLVADRHPAYGHTIDMAALIAARNDFGDDSAGWTRAYGNRGTRTRLAAFPAGTWTRAGRPKQPRPDRYGIGLDVTPDGNRYAIAAGWRDYATGWVELIDAGPVTRTTPALLLLLAQAAGVPITVDRGSFGALELLDAVARLDPTQPVVFLPAAEYASACTVFRRGILNGTLHHPNDPDLDQAVDQAATRTLGDGSQVWTRRTSAGSIAELIAATVALRAADTLPAPKRRPVAVMRTH